ncbi:hypothetical protein CTI12_AA568030 [Artemisia annua]|uniref:Uncharacterized protein n=1 Tax=Artemisia annua TaxID=35608 RepID=A0A2U1KUI9_ARTAN|nr:hypothetical protein CTI12_AA568030 [Artemisia annua]
MTNKKKQRSGRQIRAPVWLKDHVMSTMSKKSNEHDIEPSIEEIRAQNSDLPREGEDCVQDNDSVKEKDREQNSSDDNVNTSVDKAEFSANMNEEFPALSVANKNSNPNEIRNEENTGGNKIQSNSENDTNKASKNTTKVWDNKVWTDKSEEFESKLSLIPTAIEEGRDVVIFDDEMVNEGSVKWNLTLCGQFVGPKMNYLELKYNIGRMWARHIEDLNQVLESGIWLVNNRPLVVQLWNPSVNIVNTEPEVLPVWVKLYDVPLEAWTVKGLSAITSGLGKPLMMDKTTARMCHMGTGNIGYARVLVEIQANKELKDKIEIKYKSNGMTASWTKFVKVEYAWKPPRCSHCNVFGHTDNNCGSVLRNEVECQVSNDARKENSGRNNEVNIEDEFNKVEKNKKKKNGMDQGQNRMQMQYKGNVWQKKVNNQNGKDVEKNAGKDKIQQDKNVGNARHKVDNNNTGTTNAKSPNKIWRTTEKNIEELRKSANKYAVISDLVEDEVLESQVLSNKEVVDKFVKNQRQPGLEEEATWTPEMYLYFKEQWEPMWTKLIVKWAWVSNMRESLRGCRIIVGWNTNDVNVNLIHSSRLYMLCIVESIASSRRIVNNNPWILMGDWNVSLNPEDHSEGGACKTNDMVDFQERIDNIEVGDINCSEFILHGLKVGLTQAVEF